MRLHLFQIDGRETTGLTDYKQSKNYRK
jgi:hypothetical protein